MLRIMIVVFSMGLGLTSFCGEITESLKQTHGGVGGASRQLSDAIDNLSHILGTEKRPIANEPELTPKIILNGLKQIAADPAFEPKDTYESLKEQEARASDLKQKKELQDRIQEQIKWVMVKMGFNPVEVGSTTFQRDNQKVNVRFSKGEILVNPIQPLPPVDQ